MKHLTTLLLGALMLAGACTGQQGGAASTEPQVPAGLAVSEVTDSSVTVRWDAAANAELYRWAVTSGIFAQRGTTGECSATAVGLAPTKTYTFSVRSENETGASEWAELEFTTTEAIEPEPEPEPEPDTTVVKHSLKAVFIGDSITRLWPELDVAFFMSNDYMGKGIDGQTSRTIAARFKTDVVKNDPYVVHIMCGINDVAENDGYYVESSAILANIQKMAAMAEEAQIKVIIGSLTPSNKFWWRADSWTPSKSGVTVVSHIVEANELIKAWCEEAGYPFIDYYTPFVAEDGSFPEPYADDGVHPVLEGFKVMDSLVQPVLQQLLKEAGAI